MGKSSGSQFGRGDIPTVEQIVRAAICKEMKGMDYRELADAQDDSRTCAYFIKSDQRKPYSFQMFQSYISRIKPETFLRGLPGEKSAKRNLKKNVGRSYDSIRKTSNSG